MRTGLGLGRRAPFQLSQGRHALPDPRRRPVLHRQPRRLRPAADPARGRAGPHRARRARLADLCPAAGRAGHPCRARSRGRFRGAANGRHGDPGHPGDTGRAGDCARQQGPGNPVDYRAEGTAPALHARRERRHARGAADGQDRPGAADRDPLPLGPRRRGIAMADPGADGGRAPPLSAEPGAIDPQPDLDPDPGQPRHPPDLGGADHRARRRGRW